ncbi:MULTISPECIES: hypothetical protein [Halobacterium]|uniref:hypothetical protein n=1 Tax=Halobacterium TaxID=2239 RepID=UPI000AEF4D95|nr:MULTISPECIES: hypothetical protein [Halobacterium]MCG1004471.1 hypothetical protein [Halobacterium noricense]
MTDDALRKRLDAALVLLVANFLLLFGLALEFVEWTALSVLVFFSLVGYAMLHS